MKLYKLTEKDGSTYNGSMFWEVGKTNRVKKCDNPELCTSDVIHAYKNKNLALLLNPIHAEITNPTIYECRGKVVVDSWGKCGVFSLEVKKKLRYPKWFKEKELRKRVNVMFAILCAESVLNYFEKYDSEDDRPKKAIEAAKEYLKTGYRAARAAADAAADAADYAASAAARAADAADYAASAAARAAARAADYAAAYAADIDFCELADLAVREVME